MTPAVYTVSQLNNYVKSLFDNNEALAHIFVTGEISNFKAHYTGHLYMSVKDENSSIKAVMFAGNASRLRFKPENGMKIIAFGSISLYPRDGSYQLYINDMQPDGTGSLNLAFEQLKKKLDGEGLFDKRFKKEIPFFPKRVGVVTSETGAAVRDIINVINRRCPGTEIILRPVLVQGEGAAKDVAEAIALFNKYNAADVLIVGRGGGSIEDLWAFNEEIVARAVFNSTIPVVSAVGHETDFTICDFVADLRAPTPSAAAELCVPDVVSLKNELLSEKQKMYSAQIHFLNSQRERLMRIESSGALKNPLLRIADNRKKLAEFSGKINLSAKRIVENDRKTLSNYAGKLNALSPLNVIARGYSLAFKNGAPVTDVNTLSVGDELKINFKNGTVYADVKDVNGETI